MLFDAVLLTEPPQKLLTLCWRLFLGRSSDIVWSISVQRGSRYVDYVLMSFCGTLIIQDGRPKIVGTALMDIFNGW